LSVPFATLSHLYFWRRSARVAAFGFSRECGREAAIEEQAEVDARADRLFARMMANPATTQAGRAAKVRALLVHVMGEDWRGPGDPLD